MRITPLTIIKLFFILELLIAEGLYCVKLKRRKLFFVRLLPVIALMVCWAIFVVDFEIEDQFLRGLYGILMFLPLWLFSLGGIYFCFEETFVTALISSVSGYTTQKIGSLVGSLITMINPELLNFIVSGNVNIYAVINMVISDAAAYCLCFFIFARVMEKNQRCQTISKHAILISVAASFSNLVFGLFYTESSTMNKGSMLVSYSQNIICCIFVLATISGLFERDAIQKELDHERTVYAMAKENFKNEKKQTEIINQKCHDMKHRVLELTKGNAIDLSDIVDAIDIYDSSINTNNETLDVVLKQKQLVCQRNSIELNLMVDATKLSFMKSTDIYILFGNLLDNAINAVSKLDDLKKRVIYVRIFEKSGMLIIGLENMHTEKLVQKEGLYETTHSNKDNHGFGLKGISDVVKKYGGVIDMPSDECVFKTNISFMLK